MNKKSIDDIFVQVLAETGVDKNHLQGKQRQKKYISARRKFIEYALSEGYHPKLIGEALKKDRTTILFHLKPKSPLNHSAQ